VTGASGAIGSAVCDALLARGDEVIGLSRDPERARSTNPTVRWHAWRPALERPPAEAFDGVDGVINLVGERLDQRWTEEAKRAIRESRHTATRNLAQAITALERKPKVLVSQSAVGYYGDRGDSLVDESAGPGDDFAAQVVAEWERAAEGVSGAGVRLVIVRTGPALIKGAGLLGRMAPPFKLGAGGPLAGGRQYVSWVHLDDVVGIFLWALGDERVSGVVNATAPNPVTNRDLSKALGRALRRPAVMPVPGLAVDLLYGRELAEMVKGGQRVVPRRTQDLGYSFRHPRLDEALADALSDE
jgi:uncharacterized protein (TIGR01777 family)